MLANVSASLNATVLPSALPLPPDGFSSGGSRASGGVGRGAGPPPGGSGGSSWWLWTVLLPLLSSVLGLGGGGGAGRRGRGSSGQLGTGGLGGLLGGFSPISLAAAFCAQAALSYLGFVADFFCTTAFIEAGSPAHLYLAGYLEDQPPAFRLTRAFQVEVVENALAAKGPTSAPGSPPQRMSKTQFLTKELKSRQDKTMDAARQHATRSTVLPSAVKVVAFEGAYLLVSQTTMPNHHLLADSRHLVYGAPGAGGLPETHANDQMAMLGALMQKNQGCETQAHAQSRYLQIRVVPNLHIPFLAPARAPPPRKLLANLLAAAKTAYAAASPDTLRVHTLSKTCNTPTCPVLTCLKWTGKPTLSKRSTESVVLTRGQNLRLRDDLKEFLGSRKFYRERGIPFHRGILCSGPPGTGKTSLASAIAGDLGLDIFTIDLNESWMTDRFLAHAIAQTSPSCIILIEDIDVAFAPTRERAQAATSGRSAMPQAVQPSGFGIRRGRGVGADGRGGGGGRGPPSGFPAPPGLAAPVAVAPPVEQSSAVNGLTMSGLLQVLDGLGSAESKIFMCTTNHKFQLDSALIRPGRLDVHIEFALADGAQIRALFVVMMAPSAGEQARLLLDGLAQDVLDAQLGEVDRAADVFGRAVPSGLFSTAALQGFLLQHKTPSAALAHVDAWVADERTVVEAERAAREAAWDVRVREAEDRQRTWERREREAKERALRDSDDDDEGKGPPPARRPSAEAAASAEPSTEGSLGQRPAGRRGKGPPRLDDV